VAVSLQCNSNAKGGVTMTKRIYTVGQERRRTIAVWKRALKDERRVARRNKLAERLGS
jgi:hypothetical protein